MESISLILTLTLLLFATNDAYRIGLGRSDVTGPPVEIAFVSANYK